MPDPRTRTLGTLTGRLSHSFEGLIDNLNKQMQQARETPW